MRCSLVASCCRSQGTGVWQLGFWYRGVVAVLSSIGSNMGAGEARGLCSTCMVSLNDGYSCWMCRRYKYILRLLPTQNYQYTMRLSSASFSPSSIFAGFFSIGLSMGSYCTYPVIFSHCVPRAFKRPHFLAFCPRQSSISLATTIFQNPFTHSLISLALSLSLFLFSVLLTYCPSDSIHTTPRTWTSPNSSILTSTPFIRWPKGSVSRHHRHLPITY